MSVRIVCEDCGGRSALDCYHDLAQHIGHTVTFTIRDGESRERSPEPLRVLLRTGSRRPLSWRWDRPPADGVTGLWQEPEDPRCSDCPGVGKGCCVDGFDAEAYAREMGDRVDEALPNLARGTMHFRERIDVDGPDPSWPKSRGLMSDGLSMVERMTGVRPGRWDELPTGKAER